MKACQSSGRTVSVTMFVIAFEHALQSQVMQMILVLPLCRGGGCQSKSSTDAFAGDI